MTSFFFIFGVLFLVLGFKKLVKCIEQANHERRRFNLMVAEELKKLDDLYKEKQSWGQAQYKEKKWWGRN